MVNFLFIIVIKHDAIGIAVVDINGPCQGRKQEETVWIKLISYFRAHAGTHRKGKGCVVITTLELELELQDPGVHAAFSSLLLALQFLAAACRSIRESGKGLGVSARVWRQAHVHTGSTSPL